LSGCREDELFRASCKTKEAASFGGFTSGQLKQTILILASDVFDPSGDVRHEVCRSKGLFIKLFEFGVRLSRLLENRKPAFRVRKHHLISLGRARSMPLRHRCSGNKASNAVVVISTAQSDRIARVALFLSQL
jgi:hypothetical protein